MPQIWSLKLAVESGLETEAALHDPIRPIGSDLLWETYDARLKMTSFAA